MFIIFLQQKHVYYIYSLNLKIKTILGVNDLSNLKEITKIVNKVDKKNIK